MTERCNILTPLNLLIVLFLAIIVTLLISLITHKSQDLFVYIRIGVVVILCIIAAALLFMDFLT